MERRASWAHATCHSALYCSWKCHYCGMVNSEPSRFLSSPAIPAAPLHPILTPSHHSLHQTSWGCLLFTLLSSCYVQKVKLSETQVIKYLNRDIFFAALAVQSVTHSPSVTPDEFLPPNHLLLFLTPTQCPICKNSAIIIPHQFTYFLLQVHLQQLWNSTKTEQDFNSQQENEDHTSKE